MITPRLVLGLQSAELREGHLPIGPAWSSAAAGAVGVPTAAATVRATHLGERPAPPPRWLTSPSPDHYSPAA